MAMTIIIRSEDVICGKEKAAITAKGSIWFRTIIDSYATEYSQASSKYDKMALTKKICALVNQASRRFLKFNPKTQEYEELSDMVARDKVGHALRFASRTTRRRHTQPGSTTTKEGKTTTTKTPSKTSTNAHHRRRSGSISPTSMSSCFSSDESSSSSSSRSYCGDFAGNTSSLVGQMQIGMTAEDSLPTADLESSCDPLNEFLALEIVTELNDTYSNMDDLKSLFQQQQQKESAHQSSLFDPLDDMMNDMLVVVQTIDLENNTTAAASATEEEEEEEELQHFWSLMSEPLGEWEPSSSSSSSFDAETLVAFLIDAEPKPLYSCHSCLWIEPPAQLV